MKKLKVSRSEVTSYFKGVRKKKAIKSKPKKDSVKYVTKECYELMFGNDCPKRITTEKKYIPSASKGASINGVKLI
jgi:hypothetical protein